MSILQEYEDIRRELGEEEWNNIDTFLSENEQYQLSDVLYTERVWKIYEDWKRGKSNMKINRKKNNIKSSRKIKSRRPVKASTIMGAMDTENLTIYVPSYCYVDVMVDSYEQGEGEQVNSWTFQVADGFRTAQELIDDIAESSGIFSNDINDYVVLDSSLQTDATVNAENEIPTEEELEAWRRGELELYVAHLWVRLQVGSATHDITDEEAEAFGLSVY